MSFKIVIPARLHSTRLPEKIIKLIGEKTVLWYTWQQAVKSHADEVVIATDNQKIYDICHDFGAKVVMTSVDHPTGTDRIYEACKKFGWSNEQIIVNVQGDEPLIPVDYINMLAELLIENKDADVATLAHSISNQKDKQDPNLVKVVFDKWHNAIYFSRCQIPYNGKEFFGHIGIYAYRVNAIKGFVENSTGVLEASESLEQLRFLENGYSIKIGMVQGRAPIGVNTEYDYIKVKEILEEGI
ncbi:MAG: 3-deoxy-manno-octulosonate cytidylyltransferase [Francisellaceae bacterium]|jgi:3-deoxy-manno-octulosonate cytidylyltransferase (CMP-KDO synthetase)|nr:3-deoxy-manno-octulosonate cytidylyltransferase [Francisellaceae bacterium]MBT6207563.1 3-deoxy-manno-octulosonate cytidylyltransferase [Francisellaceae bacterium]MBT6538931.1 3-deoxy-manno-octulosonate cytidylyltransferase [Francisellaceae bacterium]